MAEVNVFEMKAKFAEYLDRATRGERIIICRYNTPVAELRPLETARTEPRPIGPVAGRPTFDVPPSFFEPLDDDELSAWEGVAANNPVSSAFPTHVPDATTRVADAGGSARKAPRPRKRRRT